VVLIISDLHLGSALCRAEDILKILKSDWDTLVLLGDVFSDLNFERLTRKQWDILTYLRKAGKHKEIIWVHGNHDDGLLLLGNLLGIEVVEQYEFKVGVKRCLAVHGHQFDNAILGHPRVSKIISWVFLELQKIPVRGIFKWIDKHSGRFQNISKRVSGNAIKYGYDHGYDVVICGHTHESTYIPGTPEYFNSGCWVKSPASYIRITEEIEIVEVP